MRGKGGYNSRPTLPHAKPAVRDISWNSLLHPISNEASCERDDLSVILSEIRSKLNADDRPVDLNDSFPQHHGIDLTDPDLTPSVTRDKCDKEAIAYVMGYIVRRKVACSDCKNDLTGSSESLLISFKEIEGCSLVTPNDILSTSVSTIQNFMFNNIEQIGHLPAISEVFFEEINRRQFVPPDIIKCKCDNNTSDIVIKEIIKFFMRMLCKRIKERFEKEKQKNIQKIIKWKR